MSDVRISSSHTVDSRLTHHHKLFLHKQVDYKTQHYMALNPAQARTQVSQIYRACAPYNCLPAVKVPLLCRIDAVMFFNNLIKCNDCLSLDYSMCCRD